jgi:RNA polymerase sigma-70 factor (ECF subfamily)
MIDADAHHIESCLDGHPEDFRHLIARYQRPLLAHLSRRLRGQPQVEDAAQEAFVRAYLNLVRLRDRGSFFSWLLGIANNVALEQVRRERRARKRAEEQAALEPAGEVPEACAAGEDALEQAISALPDPLREVVLLRFYDDRSCAEVAQQLGVPIGTVTKRLSRAYAQLRGLLQQAG